MNRACLFFINICFLILIPIFSIAQDLGKTIFHSVCEELSKKDKFLSVNSKLKGVYVVIDPVEGIDYIRYSIDSNSAGLKAFREYSYQDRLAILGSAANAIIPLCDTTYFVDSLHLFEDDFFYKFHNHCFQVVDRADETLREKRGVLFTYAFSVRSNSLLVAFSFNNNKEYFSFYFGLDNCALKFLKSGHYTKK